MGIIIIDGCELVERKESEKGEKLNFVLRFIGILIIIFWVNILVEVLSNSGRMDLFFCCFFVGKLRNKVLIYCNFELFIWYLVFYF